MKRLSLVLLGASVLLVGCNRTPDVTGVWTQVPTKASKGTIHTITFYKDGVYEDRLQADNAPTAIINRGTFTIVEGKLFTSPENVDLVAFSAAQKKKIEADKKAKQSMLEPSAGKMIWNGNDEFEFVPDKPANDSKTPAEKVIFRRKK
jgi:hypothetical protein